MSEPVRQRISNPTIIQSGLILAVVAAICTTLVALTFSVTKDRIAANERAFLERSLTPVLAGKSFDNDFLASAIIVPAPHELPGTENAVIYRALANNSPVAALFVVTAPDGYSGPIKLLIGIDFDGVVLGVRAIEHKETPGLGDLIDASRSDWIYQFAGTSLNDPEQNAWAIRRDGGAFDQLTGASITSRAAVNAVNQTLLYFAAKRDNIFTAQADSGTAHE
jgi:electron transport complex protein RnfG